MREKHQYAGLSETTEMLYLVNSAIWIGGSRALFLRRLL